MLGIVLALQATRLQAQYATWIGPATGGEWNTAADWDLGVPGVGTNALIGSGTNLSYNFPMAAASIGSLTNNGVFTINTNGFNASAIYLVLPTGGDLLYMSNGAVVTASSFIMTTNSRATLYPGASLTVGSLEISYGTSSKANGTTYFTNSGGTLSASSTTINNNSGTGTGLLVINGGTNNLGTTTIGRYNGSGLSTAGTEGLAIYNGLVLMTNLNVGGGYAASYDTAYVTGGTITNFGSMYLNNATAGRYSRFLQTGGLFVTPDPGVINPNSTVAGTQTAVYSIQGGTNIMGGFYFGNSNNTAAATENFTNAASVYIGSQGIAGNGGAVLNISLNNGGLFGATTNWVDDEPMTLATGSFTFRAADLTGDPYSISVNGVLGGPGSLIKTGGGTLSLGAANTYSGKTLINAGTLALSAGGTLASPVIYVGSGATFDESAAGSYVLNSGQTLGGFGVVTGAVTVASGAIVQAGSNALTGTLSFSNSVTETGGAVNNFYLSSSPSGPNNDLLVVAGDLDVSGTNTISVTGSLPNGAVYPLIAYAGSFNGAISNFALTGAVGLLTNNTGTKTISLITLATIRGPTNIVWLGNPLNTNWDTSISTNWLVGAAPDYFIPNDNVLFSNLGASNNPVNIVGTVNPGSITVNSSSNYVFAGSGVIAGLTGLTLASTDTGILTVLTTNDFSGATVIDGGELAVSYLAIGGLPSNIGASSSDSGNLVVSNGTFMYFGPAVSIDRGATLGGTAVFDTAAGTSLTLGGTLQGTGGLTVVDAGTLVLSGANSYTGVTTLTGGTLAISSVASALGTGGIDFDSGTLDLTGVGSQPTFAGNIDVVTNSLVVSGNNDIISGNWTGVSNVTMNVSIPGSGNTFTLNGSLTNFTGTMELGNSAGTFRFNAGGGNTTFGGPNTTFDLGTNTAILQARNAGTMALGALFGSSGTFVLGQGSGTGTLIWSIGSSTNTPNSIFWGSINDGSAANRICGITKVGPGTLTLGGVNNFSGTTTISSGTLALVYNPTNGTDGALNNSGTINLVSGAVLDVSGRSDGTLQLGSSQTLEGRGTVIGALNANGTVAPGGGVGGNTGTLTVTNSVSLAGTAWMKINRANSPNSDNITCTLSYISYGGTLVVTNIGAALQVGDTFTLFTASSYQNSFGTLVLPDYYTWNTANLAVNGTITVTGVAAPPAIGSVDYSQFANGTITLNATNGLSGGTVNVLSTTNLALPLASWTVAASANFDGNGNASIPVTVNPAQSAEFFTLQAQ